ncbi:MAG: hypothetical protein ACRCXX_09690 [Cetobacterium sp.]|uniref:hypothetical protein n=1 Tax=Cetobacterium sp. TaxID=2071632 RepID=UPI003F31668D
MEILKCKNMLNISPKEIIEKNYEKIMAREICFDIESRLVRLTLQETLKRKNLELGKHENEVNIIFVDKRWKRVK